MSKPKLKSKAAPADSKPKASAGGKTIVESAQHIWLAGLGAFAKAQDEGTRLFEALVREGVSLEQKTRKLTAGKADEARGMIVKAFCVLRPGFTGDEALVKALQDHVKASIAPFKYPREIEFMDKLPRTETGKLQRFKLKSL